MTQEAMLKQILSELAELKAEVAQLGPVRKTASLETELDEVVQSGGDVIQFYKDRRKKGRAKC